MNLLITGTSGFVGSALYKYASNMSDINCIGVSRSGVNSDISFDELFESDTLSRVDVIIHTIGRAHGSNVTSLSEFTSTDVDVLKRLLDKSINTSVRRVVLLSSINVYSSNSKAISFTTEPKATSINGMSKLAAESLLIAMSNKNNFEFCILRSCLIYGKDAPGNFGALTELVKRLPVLPFGLANNRRDFIAVQNLSDLLVTCAIHPAAAGHIFLASDGETVSLKEFTNAMAKGLGKKVFQLPVPVGLMRLVGKVAGKSATMEQLFGNLEVDSSNTREILGWTPPFTMEQSMALLKHTDK
ncbi:NAD-dependent epimerase/dehydratase family protein [Vibrio vulnificus]|nr:NAD-dependent epimerase/dehydratase family protein [Vibrio vulnificus]